MDPSSSHELARHWLDPPEVQHALSDEAVGRVPLSGEGSVCSTRGYLRGYGCAEAPVTRAQVPLLALRELGLAIEALTCRRLRKKHLRGRFFNGRRRAANVEVICAEVCLLRGVQLGLDRDRVALVSVTGARQRHEVVLFVNRRQRSAIAVFEVTRLDLGLKVFVLALRDAAHAGVGALVRSHETVAVAAAQLDGRLLGEHVVEGVARAVVPQHSVLLLVGRRKLVVGVVARSNGEVGGLGLFGAASLVLGTAGEAGPQERDVALLAVDGGGVLAHDEVGGAEGVHFLAAFGFGHVLAAVRDSLAYRALKLQVCHAKSNCQL